MSIQIRPISRVLLVVGHALVGTGEGLRAAAPRRSWLVAGAIVGAAAAGAALAWLAMSSSRRESARPAPAPRADVPPAAYGASDGVASSAAPEPFE